MSSIGALCTLISNHRACFLLLVTEAHRGGVLVAAAVPSHVHNLGVESLDRKDRRVPSLGVPTLVWPRLQIYLRTLLQQGSPRTSSCCFWLLVPAALLHSQVYVPSWADWACPRYSSLPTANTCARPSPSPGRG